MNVRFLHDRDRYDAEERQEAQTNSEYASSYGVFLWSAGVLPVSSLPCGQDVCAPRAFVFPQIGVYEAQ